MRRRRLRAVCATVAAAAVTLAGCTSDGGEPAPSEPRDGSASVSAPGPDLYLSVGDSYAAGYQPAADGSTGSTSRAGFPYQVVSLAKRRGVDLTLYNVACSGATTTEVLRQKGCAFGDAGLGPGAESYDDRTQAQAAVRYAKEHRGRIRLVTVSLGGNDIRDCVASASVAAASTCVSQKLTTITTNLRTLVRQLRDVVGPRTQILGVGYPDVFLGEALSRDPQRRQLADVSVLAFRSLVTPQLTQAYTSAGGRFVDIAAATGAYLPATRTTDLPPYGTIPTRVARICRLTWYCEYGDIHPRASGYRVIAQQVVRQL